MQNNTRSENERTSDSFACKKRREVNGKFLRREEQTQVKKANALQEVQSVAQIALRL